MVHGLPIPAAVCEVLPLLQLRLHQGTADTGVAVSVNAETEPRARNANLCGVTPLHHAVVSVTPFLHCFHDVRLSTPVLLKTAFVPQGFLGRLQVSGNPAEISEAGLRKSMDAATP